MAIKSFGKKDTLTVKGIAIILMYIHHLFYTLDYFSGREIKTLFLSQETLVNFSVGFGKVCVAIFVFLTAYGLTRSFERVNDEKTILKSTFKRYIKLEAQFSFVVIISLIVCFITKIHNPADIYGRDILQSLFFGVIDILGFASFWGGVTLNASWWYMSLAITLVFLIPILWNIYIRSRYLGILLLPVSILLPKLLGMYESVNNGIILESTNISWYFFTIMFGIVTASENLLEKAVDYRSKCKYSVVTKIGGGLIFLFIMGYIRMRWGLISITEGIITFLICFLVFYISEVKIIRVIINGLRVLGKYSMNMYLIHSFVFLYILSDFIYSFRYPAVILIVLIIITLLLAICLEWLKSIIKLEKGLDIIYLKIDKIFDGRIFVE